MSQCHLHDSLMKMCCWQTEGDEAAVQEATDWLQIYKQPQSRVLELWRKTAKSRLDYIHSASQPTTMTDIIQKWPRYGDHDGHILVRSYYS